MAKRQIQETTESESVLEQIEAVEVALQKVDGEIEEAKDNLKDLKDLRETHIASMRRLARSRMEEAPLFDSHDGDTELDEGE